MDDKVYREHLEALGEDVVRYRLGNRMPIGNKPENNPSPEFAGAWLAEKAKARIRKDNFRFWVIFIVAVVSAIAAVIAALPVIKSWMG
jgi:hypothetical protein